MTQDLEARALTAENERLRALLTETAEALSPFDKALTIYGRTDEPSNGVFPAGPIRYRHLRMAQSVHAKIREALG